MDKQSIKYTVDYLNWDHMRRNLPFVKGLVKHSPEHEDVKGKKKLRQFGDLPAFLPIKVRDMNES
jgi:hypothetical protein